MNRETQDFERFMREREQAAKAYVRGDAGPLGRIVAHTAPATFFGPAGGVDQGAAQVYSRYQNDAAQFAEGDSDFEILHMAASEGLAYWVGIQRASVRMAKDEGKGERAEMKLRITEVFRREGTEWKLLHRHADMLKGDGAEKK